MTSRTSDISLAVTLPASGRREKSARRTGRSLKFLALCAFAVFGAPAHPQQAGVWALSAGGVWIQANNGSFSRSTFNPATGRIGDMGTGVIYKAGDAPANAQAGSALAIGAGFDKWNAVAAAPVSARVNFVAGNANINSTVSWAERADPGAALNAAVNNNPRNIQLNRVKTLRTDKWNIDLAGTRPAVIDEYDIFTVTFHEAGHVLGLGHPKPAAKTLVMDAQNRAREAGGSWRAIEKTAPFAGQPMTLAGAALPNGARAYQDPRAELKFGDAMGAITLYSAPMGRVAAAFIPGVGGGTYEYTLVNESSTGVDMRSGYLEREVRIPVSTLADTSSLIAPADWSIVREPNAVVVTYVGPDIVTEGGLLPGDDMTFSFFSSKPPAITQPFVRWAVDGLIEGDGTDADIAGTGSVVPEFNVSDFGVLDGRFTYTYFGGWQTLLMPSVLAPIPEPSIYVLMLTALGVIGIVAHRRKSRAATPHRALSYY